MPFTINYYQDSLRIPGRCKSTITELCGLPITRLKTAIELATHVTNTGMHISIAVIINSKGLVIKRIIGTKAQHSNSISANEYINRRH